MNGRIPMLYLVIVTVASPIAQTMNMKGDDADKIGADHVTQSTTANPVDLNAGAPLTNRMSVEEIPGKVKRAKVQQSGAAVDGQYLLMVQDEASDDEVSKALAEAKVLKSKRHKFGVKSDILWVKEVNEQQIQKLQDHVNVFRLIEPDLITKTTGCITYKVPNDWGLDRLDASLNDNLVGWDRVSASLNNFLTMSDSGTGIGVDAYVVDTGVTQNDEEFEGRLTYGFSISSSTADEVGHGSHVADVLGGAKYGVAKNVHIISIKVIGKNSYGTVTDFVDGLAWIKDRVSKTKRKSVVNVSLRWPRSDSINSAVRGLVERGIVVVVAAGNDGRDACEYSPASEPAAICVGATNWFDEVYDQSNSGPCVDIYAPGVNIVSISNVPGDSQLVYNSGTSMAAPFVAGAAASYLSQLPSFDVLPVDLALSVKNAIFSNATAQVLFNKVKTTDNHNRLLHLKC